MDKELDELISKYTDDLMKLKEKWNQWGIETEKPAPPPANETPDNTPSTERNESPTDSEISSEETVDDTAISPEKDSTNISPTDEIPKSDPENFAMFTARIFTGNQAYPIANAKVSVYLDGKLHLFLITDENGETEKVKLEAFPGINSFIPESTNQTLNYSADIYADGFTERKGLLVGAVGGSDILLNVQLTPLSERID
ncbi:MAG: hypothetical protein J6Q79_00505 [Clostridia bacterium]|nr:hypothetical protein [Clostridia bacterium]